MASVSPPKPWERPNSAGAPGTPLTTSPTANTSNLPASGTSSQTIATAPTTSSASQPPTLPSRPNTLNSAISQPASNYSPYGASRLASGPYTGYGYSSYSSPYSRFGSMYGGYGGYGGMYGGYGGMYGGMQNGDPNSLTNSFNQSTQATFQMIESIVGAFGGFAQMLESTYMATHSSFFAMVSVAEQFGNLRNTLGSVLGIFTILRWIRTLFARLTGRPLPANATSLTPSAFSSFLSKSGSSATLSDNSRAPPRPSKKPFFFFLAAVFGLPYLMGKLIRALARSQEAEIRRQQEMAVGANPQAGPIDPSKLDFCRVLYDYTPGTQAAVGIDLAVRKGDIVAVLSKTDPMGSPSEWWRCRARDGSVGYLPGPYLQTIQRKPQQRAITEVDNGPVSAAQINTFEAFPEQTKATKGEDSLLTIGKGNTSEARDKIADISQDTLQKKTLDSEHR
ncbi:peroxisomal membrane protein PAS20, putative [Coccidioides posadasii C735 delta SOWgp]|uniref:Peroxisomal membrane protein PEX13 n=1 Tax=Coccidioides posadasii (strain C735) TaxID=222929 RepID=C5P2P4_COCP7|nr:peroxisomal membrane protein PAS20, putative [Coccidioides posadasii C735 delta SOWgp]EER28582.1 peroxisomal membrane protein PAS20, putative [Coccidioides posadasii C735 delta SOWgp]|eukprot:XP_003070727.1 peroxisomal membrane protein PAS20, putative [Coccidioides posadasii C735 delta SOWgp]